MNRQWLGLRRLAGVAFLVGAALPVIAGDNVPYTPTDDSTVLERVRQIPAAADSEFRRLEQASKNAPQDLTAALAFARAALRLGNEESDPRYFGYAQSALAPWWKLPGPPIEVMQLRADILQWQHQFDAAKRDLDAIIKADNRGVNQAHLTLATVELVQGEPDAARHDCVALIDHVETLIAATCIAAVNSLTGNATLVAHALGLAIAQSKGASNDALLWAWTEMAEIAERTGQPDEAGQDFGKAMAVMQSSGRRDPYLLAAYADFLLDQNRPTEVVKLLDGLSRMDNLLLRLALAENALGTSDPVMQARAIEHTNDLQRRFDETRQRGDFVHQREEALYWLHLRHSPAQALLVARDNWQRQRELIDARVLIDSARAAGEPDSAMQARDWLRRYHIDEARL